MPSQPCGLHRRHSRIESVVPYTSAPAKKGQVYFGLFYLGKRKRPATGIEPVAGRFSLKGQNRRKYLPKINPSFFWSVLLESCVDCLDQGAAHAGVLERNDALDGGTTGRAYGILHRRRMLASCKLQLCRT